MVNNINDNTVMAQQQPASQSPMPNMPGPAKRGWFSYKKMLAGILIIAIATAAVIVAWPSKKPNTTAVSPWGEFTSQQYHFKFTYLKAWGIPSVTKSDAKTGFAYSISFQQPTKVDPKTKAILPATRDVTASMETSDWVPPNCPPAYECDSQPAITASYIDQHTNDEDSTIVYHSAASYLTITKKKNISPYLALDAYQKLVIPFQDISAVHGVILTNLDSAHCSPTTTWATAACIKQSDYDNFSKFLKSISGI